MKRKMSQIDKAILQGIFTITGVSNSTTLDTFNYPGTIVGLRWEMQAKLSNVLSENGILQWCLSIVKDGQASPEIAGMGGNKDLLSKGSPKDLFASGFLLTQKDDVVHPDADSDRLRLWPRIEGKVKTSRKVQSGDKLVLTTIGNAVLGQSLFWQVQYFIKS